MNGHYEVVQILLSAGADLKMINNAGHTALVEAIIEGQEPISRLLISRGADVNARDLSGYSAGETPLIVAAMKGKTEIAAMLIAKGAKVNMKTKDGQTALIYAARAPEDRSAIAKLLIENGADMNVEDNTGMTALTYALKNRDVLLFKILMESGAKE
jgi:ankyrin repeat protein